MLKPICVQCQRFFRCKKTGVYFVEAYPTAGARPQPGTAEPERWRPYKLWAGDRWQCDGCGATIISGCGSQPIAEHYHPDFADQMRALNATLQINDC